MNKTILTWDKGGQRWKKMYRGRWWWGKRGQKKSDPQAYRQAVDSFREWQARADADLDANKPHADQYRQAIELRQAMLAWLQLERDNQEAFDTFLTIERDGRTETISAAEVGLATFTETYDRLAKEIDRLKRDYARLSPPALDTPGTLHTDPLALCSVADSGLF